jgi:hypothetical protein
MDTSAVDHPPRTVERPSGGGVIDRLVDGWLARLSPLQRRLLAAAAVVSGVALLAAFHAVVDNAVEANRPSTGPTSLSNPAAPMATAPPSPEQR